MASLRVTLAILLFACSLNAFESLQQDKIAPSLKRKRLTDIIRKKRSPEAFYSPWTPPYLTTIIKIPVQQGLTLWQSQSYQINRPYLIPVLGASGKLPIYFPPQPLYNNPGFPVDNPPNNAYLPPKPSEDNGTISTMNKFDGDDSRPVWDMTDGDSKSSTVKPTRRPKPSGLATSTHPPIIRDEKTTTSSAATTSNKITGAVDPRPNPNQNLPSRCVWAIISCCSASSNTVSYDCFEQLGCNGAFWDDSPCDGDVARAAISNVMNYYQSK